MVLRKVVVCLLVIIILISMCACGDTKNDDGVNIYEIIDLPDSAVKLNKSDLSAIKQWFNDDTIRLRFLDTTFSDPADIDLYTLFYYGDGKTFEPQVADIQAFLKQYGWWGDFQTSKVTVDAMNDVLEKYAGISYEDTNKVHLDGLYYVEDGDCYYSLHGDTSETEFDPVFGYKTGEKVCLFYENSIKVNTRMTGTFMVTLKEKGNDYYFVSNEFCDISEGNIEYTTEVYSKADSDDVFETKETVQQITLTKNEEMSASSLDKAIENIVTQSGFEEMPVTGQTWTNISEYGDVKAGIIDEKTVVYFIDNKGNVYDLPLMSENSSPANLLFGGGDNIFNYMIEEISSVTDESGMPTAITDYYGTILLPTNELYIRVVQSTLNDTERR